MSKCDNCSNDGGVGEHLMCQPCKDKHEEALFKEPPRNEDCPICFLLLPFMSTGSKYQSCCGKIICSGCIHAVLIMDPDKKCPFCRVPLHASDEEIMERYKRRVEVDDADAIYNLGCFYSKGIRGVPQNYEKALGLWRRSGERGYTGAYHNVANAYYYGRGVERDMKNTKHYWELAAIGGGVMARYNLGIYEEMVGDMSRSLNHYMIAAECGYDKSLKKIREFYMNGNATKADYAKALRAHQSYMDGIKSAQRDEAASAHDNDEYRYR